MFFSFPNQNTQPQNTNQFDFNPLSDHLLERIDTEISQHIDDYANELNLNGEAFIDWGKIDGKNYELRDEPEDFRFSTILRHGPGGARKQACIDTYKRLENHAYNPNELTEETTAELNYLLKKGCDIYALLKSIKHFENKISTLISSDLNPDDMPILDSFKMNYSHFVQELEETVDSLAKHYNDGNKAYSQLHSELYRSYAPDWEFIENDGLYGDSIDQNDSDLELGDSWVMIETRKPVKFR